MTLPKRIKRYGDRGFLVSFDPQINHEVNRSVFRLTSWLQDNFLGGVTAILPAFCSVTVSFDPDQVHAGEVETWLQRAAQDFEQQIHGDAASNVRTVEIPVCYERPFALDAERLEERSGLSWDAFVNAHAAVTYQVMMNGFLPGFAYLASVAEAIQCPRHETPRLEVPAGSVGIADALTGIYPVTAPGGWQIIGRTPISLTDAGGQDFLLKHGDQVAFRRISIAEFRQLEKDNQKITPPQRLDEPEESTLTFIRSGIQTTIQDQGRIGYQAYGVPLSGPMDRASAKAANLLVGNAAGAASFEITLLGPSISFSQTVRIAIVGANLSPTVDGVPVAMNQALVVEAGGTLRFGKRQEGCRCYLAIEGQLDVPQWLGSRSATLPFASRWTPRSLIQMGQEIQVKASSQQCSVAQGSATVDSWRSNLRSMAIKIWPGPEFEMFSTTQQQAIAERPFQITADSNRMGYRLDRSIIEESCRSHDAWQDGIISSNVFPGVIQVPPSGVPVVLMADCQTSGGYARLAVVDSTELDRLGQLAPGDSIRFVWTGLDSP